MPRTFMQDRSLSGLLRRHAVFFGGLAAILIAAFIVWNLAHTAAQNRRAIEKSCTLLNNAIIRSTQASNDPNSPSAALITGILTVIPSKYIDQYRSRSSKITTVIPLIDCEEVANHPDQIHAIPLRVTSGVQKKP